MGTPTQHALLSASSSERWLNCTAAPRFEAGFPSETSVYAQEGTLAHAICEVSAQYNFNKITKRTLNSRLKKFREHELFQEEMIKTAEFYAEYLYHKALSFENPPYVVQEVKVDLTEYIPDGFGTCDCVMIGGDTLHITDYKHGKGVEVSAVGNPQMRLYALGALQKYNAIYGGNIKKVSMAIVQPRITEDVSEDAMTTEELLAWAEEIKPIAMKAHAGFGEFVPGEWCRFCKGRAVCRKRAEVNTALEEFKDVAIEGRVTAEEKAVQEQIVATGGELPPMLSDADVADLLIRGAQLVQWYKDLEEYAVGALLQGKDIPGFKLVAGKSNRVFKDADAAMELIKKAGYDEAILYERKALSLSNLEKLLGKKAFEEVCGDQVHKPLGKPTLVPASDMRVPYSTAAADFAEVSGESENGSADT